LGSRWLEQSFQGERAKAVSNHIFEQLVDSIEDLPSETMAGNYIMSNFRSEFAMTILTASAIVGGILIGWSFVARGGISFPFAGLALVRSDGRKAARWQCAIRAIVIWVPPLVLLSLCICVRAWSPQLLLLHNSLWFSAVLWLVGYAVIGILYPGRGPQDRLSGVWVVPR
jgi:hypothetical protein